MRLFLLLSVVSLLIPGSATAAIVSVVGNAAGQGTITANVNSQNMFIVNVDKTYDQLGSMFIDIAVNSNGNYVFQETITNNTGITWTDFHWELTGVTTGTFSFGLSPTLPFPVVSTSTTSGAVHGGLLPTGLSFDGRPVLSTSDSGIFTLRQFPSIASSVPEPSAIAIWTVLGFLGLRVYRRKGRGV